MSLIHPLSPSCFPNPIYKLPNPEPEAELFSQRKNIYLNDAGMDNNLPLYPLLRPGRNIDVILAFDSSADIESVPWFEKTGMLQLLNTDVLFLPIEGAMSLTTEMR